MNWTGGNLKRHSKPNSSKVTKSQKQYFAKARLKSQTGLGVPSSLQSPITTSNCANPEAYILDSTHDIPPAADEHKQKITSRIEHHNSHGRPAIPENKFQQGHAEKVASTSTITHDTNVPKSFEEIKRSLLQRPDWLGISVAKPLQISFVPAAKMEKIGRHRKPDDRRIEPHSKNKAIPTTSKVHILPRTPRQELLSSQQTDDISIRIGSKLHSIPHGGRSSQHPRTSLHGSDKLNGYCFASERNELVQKTMADIDRSSYRLMEEQNVDEFRHSPELPSLGSVRSLSSFDEVRAKSSSSPQDGRANRQRYVSNKHRSQNTTSKISDANSNQIPSAFHGFDMDRDWSTTNLHTILSTTQLAASPATFNSTSDGRFCQSRNRLSSSAANSQRMFTLDEQVAAEVDFKRAGKKRSAQRIAENITHIRSNTIDMVSSSSYVSGAYDVMNDTSRATRQFNFEASDLEKAPMSESHHPLVRRDDSVISTNYQSSIHAVAGTSFHPAASSMFKSRTINTSVGHVSPIRTGFIASQHDNTTPRSSFDENKTSTADFEEIHRGFEMPAKPIYEAITPQAPPKQSLRLPILHSTTSRAIPICEENGNETSPHNSIHTGINTTIFSGKTSSNRAESCSDTDFLSQLSPMEGVIDERGVDLSVYNNAPRTERNSIHSRQSPNFRLKRKADQAFSENVRDAFTNMLPNWQDCHRRPLIPIKQIAIRTPVRSYSLYESALMPENSGKTCLQMEEGPKEPRDGSSIAEQYCSSPFFQRPQITDEGSSPSMRMVLSESSPIDKGDGALRRIGIISSAQDEYPIGDSFVSKSSPYFGSDTRVQPQAVLRTPDGRCSRYTHQLRVPRNLPLSMSWTGESTFKMASPYN